MSDEQIELLIESIEDDSEDSCDYDSDCSDPNPDDVPDEIEAETQQMIHNALREMDEGETSYAFVSPDSDDLTFDMSEMEFAASSTMHEVAANETVESEESAAAENQTSTSAASQPSTSGTFKRPKRPRSPLPTVEEDGPQATPNSGGLIGSRE